MLFFKKKKKVNLVTEYLENHRSVSIKDREGALNYLQAFIENIRPPHIDTNEAETRLELAIRLLHQQPSVLVNLRSAILAQFINSNLIPMLTQSGITVSRGVGRELYARLKHKFLPPLQDPNDFLYLLNRIFYRQTDYVWVEKIGREKWMQLFETIGLSFSGNERTIIRQATLALHILSARVSQLGFESDITRNAPARLLHPDNPFAKQHALVQQLDQLIVHGTSETEIRSLSGQLKKIMADGLEMVQCLREETAEKGTSISQTFILLQIEQQIMRMQLVLDIVDGDGKINFIRFVDMFTTIIRNENRKNSLREFLSKTTGYLAYQIAEHKGKKGGKYITSTPQEYARMLVSAMWGGFIVCFMAIIKNLLGMLSMAPFWQGIAYSINYSLGFVLIEETKSTLATKQPAFTASAVASSLDGRKADNSPNLYNLAVTVSKISRSQIASFIGNLIIVFPITYLLANLYDLVFGHPIANTEKAIHMLRDQHPWQSMSLLYACNTGFFLFLSGIIAGYVQNKINYSRISKRLTDHPVLGVYVPRKRLQQLAHYLEHHTGGLAGNIALGFFLGMAASVVKIFGIPFDIRHITISAANTSIAVYGIGWHHISYSYLAVVIAGVLCIGFLNFLVSFSLAFIVAVRSRGIRLRDYPEFLQILWKYFRSHPLDFIRPRKRIDIQAATA